MATRGAGQAMETLKREKELLQRELATLRHAAPRVEGGREHREEAEREALRAAAAAAEAAREAAAAQRDGLEQEIARVAQIAARQDSVSVRGLRAAG